MDGLGLSGWMDGWVGSEWVGGWMDGLSGWLDGWRVGSSLPVSRSFSELKFYVGPTTFQNLSSILVPLKSCGTKIPTLHPSNHPPLPHPSNHPPPIHRTKNRSRTVFLKTHAWLCAVFLNSFSTHKSCIPYTDPLLAHRLSLYTCMALLRKEICEQKRI